MKSAFAKLFHKLSTWVVFPALIAFSSLATLTVDGQQSSYRNTGNITIPPQVNATNFFNSGTWDIISSPKPYSTQNTLNYFNSGSMDCSIGWDFQFMPSSGSSGWSSSFTNTAQGSITAGSTLIRTSITQLSPVGYLLVLSTNIVNKGSLVADANSMIQLTGSNVDLSRSQIQITPVSNAGSDNDVLQQNFLPSASIYDEFWGLGVNGLIDSTAVWNGKRASSVVPSAVTGVCSENGNVEFAFPPTFADSIINFLPQQLLTITLTNMDGSTTNILLATNIASQAVFILTGNPNISAGIRFSPSSIATNPSMTVAVELSAPFTNLVTGTIANNSIFFVDTLASETNSGLYVNTTGNPNSPCSTSPTFRPANYNISRSDPGAFGSGQPGNGVPTNNFFFNAVTNPIVNMNYATYSAEVDNEGAQVPPGGSVTNLPGRVQITADNLNLNNTSIRAEGELVINAKNFLGSTNAVIDCENLSYNLGAVSGLVNVTNLAKPIVSRLNGTISAWSATWQNTEFVIITNNFTVTNTLATTNMPAMTNAVPSPLTNAVSVTYYVLLLDADQLATTVPVNIQGLNVTSTNAVVNDTLTVNDNLLFNGISLTVNGGLTLGGTISAWNQTIAPNVLYFTNNGVLTIPDTADFGDDRTTNYITFINNGTIGASSEAISTAFYQNSGVDDVSGEFFLTAGAGLIQNGTINSGQDVDLNSGVLKLVNAKIIAGGAVNFNVANSLFDAGSSSSNQITCNAGFNLSVLPAAGDLLGTTITSIAENGAEVDSSWAGQDRGATAAGFLNNEAVGRLVLSPQGIRTPLFYFAGVGSTNNALYVDDLNLAQLGTNFAQLSQMLEIDPSLVIYYASAELGFTPPTTNGISQEAEEFLNGQFGGHLVWVPSFAGPNSSVFVLINGQSVLINRALRNSKIIDSNGNGIPNFFDVNPFDAAPFIVAGSLAQANPPSSGQFAISWLALPNSIYQVEFTTNLVPGNWQPLLSYTNSGSASQHITIWDTNKLSNQRFYRESVLLQVQ